jgi:adenylate cyclase
MTAGEAAITGSPSDIGRALHRRLIVIYLVATLAATGSGACFFLFGLDFTTEQMKLVIGLIAPLATAPQVATDLILIARHVRPIRAFFDALPGPAADELAETALAQSLNLPLYTAARVLLVHAPTLAVALTVLSLLANQYLALGLAFWQFVLFYVTIIVFASGHAIYEYLAVKAAVAKTLPFIRARVSEAARDELTGVRRLRMHAKLLLVFAFVACVPLASLGLTVLLKLERQLGRFGMMDAGPVESPLVVWVVLVVFGGSAVALFLSQMLSRDIASSAEELAAAMRRVEHGDVAAQLVVDSTDEFAEAHRGFNRMTRGLVERERLRDAFGRYVAPELAEEVMKRGVSMGGSLVHATVIFIDIRGFTSLSERMKPVEVVSLLNRYFGAVNPPIRAENGFINKFGGDSLLAVFGAPVPDPDHALRATRAALGVREALRAFNAGEEAAGRVPVRIGIGVHTGEMVAGSVGSPDRMEYTVIGDVVNVAARIQGLNKDFGTDILLSETTYDIVKLALGDRPARVMPAVAVRGKSDPLVVHAL